jgi:hypothetical protein
MNPRTIAARSAPFLPAAETDRGTTAEVLFSTAFPDWFSHAMDQALGIEKPSLAPIVGLNSCLFDIYKNALWFTPAFGNHSEMMSQALACVMEFQMKCFTLLPPQTTRAVNASNFRSETQPTEEELARSMDVALGERFTESTSIVASSPAIMPSRRRRAAERHGQRYRGAGGRLTLPYPARKATG